MPPDDSLHLELTQLIEDQKREEIRLRQEQNLRWAFFVTPILFLILGHIFTPHFWFLPMAFPAVAAILGASFKGSEDRFHALFWGNVLAISAYFLYMKLGSAIPTL